MRPNSAACGLLLAAVALAGCTAPGGKGGGAGPPAATTSTDPGDFHVAARDNAFEPPNSSAVVGVPVLWKNVGLAHHTVTVQRPGGAAGDWLADSNDLEPGARFSYTFAGAGTYDVFCRYHSQGDKGVFDASAMTMKVTVG